MSLPPEPVHIGEVVESSSLQIVAQCLRDGETPALGLFVRVPPEGPDEDEDRDPFCERAPRTIGSVSRR